MIHGLYKGIKLNVSIKNQLGIILYPNEIHTPGIFLQRIFQGKKYEKRIEQRTVK